MSLAVTLVLALGTACRAAPDAFCRGEHVQVAGGTIRLASHWTPVLAEGFDRDLSGWKIENYENKLTLSVAPNGTTGSCLLVTNEGQTGDTAFEVASNPIPLAGGTRFALQFSWRSNRGLDTLSGHQGHYLNLVQWLDNTDAPIEVLLFSFGSASEPWQVKRLEGAIPPRAAGAAIRFGFDSPDLPDRGFLAIDDLRLEVQGVTASFEPAGAVHSRPIRAPDGDGLAGGVARPTRAISWQADTPPGTGIRFQVASAPDKDGGPGEWSEPLGPDGTKGAFFTAPGALPAVHSGRPWLRHVATLSTTVPGKTPILRSVSLGKTTDGPWTGSDVDPPTVVDRSPTRTADARGSISFRLTDQTGVDPRTVQVRLDGADITGQVVAENGQYVYRPAEPLRPPADGLGMALWHATNYNGQLTLDRSAQREPDGPRGFHITRQAAESDTAFRLQSPPIPVEPGAKYRLSYWSRHSLDLGGVTGKGVYSTGVIWLDAHDMPVGQPDPIDLGEANAQWHRDAKELTAPLGAVQAQISFGFDSPNLFGGAFVDLAEVALDGPHPAGVSDEPNLHQLTVHAADFAGNEMSRDWYLLIRAPRTQNVATVRDDGVTLIDGKPFFPIGLYAVWKKAFNENSFDKAFGDLKAAGFNLAHTYSSGRGPDFREFYAAAARHGIRLFVASDAGANCTDAEAVLWDVVREEGEPALLAWYLADDTASHVGHDELRSLSEAIHDVDPAHITVQADGVGSPPVSRYTKYVNSTDGFLPELYPIRDDSDQGVSRIIADMQTIRQDLKAAGTHQRPIWAIVQYFQGWGWPRYPTRDELWAMSYLSIIHGATGITWYTYGGSGANHGVTDNPEVWKNICDLAGELAKLQEVLVERTGPQPPAPEVLQGPPKDALGYPSLSVLLKEHGGKKYLIVANSARAEVTARFTAGARGQVVLPFEAREIAAEAGGFSDRFGPYQVHVYVWQ